MTELEGPLYRWLREAAEDSADSPSRERSREAAAALETALRGRDWVRRRPLHGRRRDLRERARERPLSRIARRVAWPRGVRRARRGAARFRRGVQDLGSASRLAALFVDAHRSLRRLTVAESVRLPRLTGFVRETQNVAGERFGSRSVVLTEPKRPPSTHTLEVVGPHVPSPDTNCPRRCELGPDGLRYRSSRRRVRRQLGGHSHPALHLTGRLVGAAPAGTKLEISAVLPLRNASAINGQISPGRSSRPPRSRPPSGPPRHRWTPSRPTCPVGLRRRMSSPNRLLVTGYATVAQAERAFDTTIDATS